MLAIDPELCDMERVRDFAPSLPELRTNPFALLDPFFLATPGSFWSLLEDGGGVWGNRASRRPRRVRSSSAGQHAGREPRARHGVVHDRIEPGYRRAAKRR